MSHRVSEKVREAVGMVWPYGKKPEVGWMRYFKTYRIAFKVNECPDNAFLMVDGLFNEKVIGDVNRDVFIYLNGVTLKDFKPSDVLDHYMYKLDVSRLLKQGVNEILVEGDRVFYEAAEINDPMILLGDFSVEDWRDYCSQKVPQHRKLGQSGLSIFRRYHRVYERSRSRS